MQTLVEGLSACQDYVQLLQQLDKAAERAVDTELAHLSELNEPYLARELSRSHATGPLWGMWGAAESAPYGIVSCDRPAGFLWKSILSFAALICGACTRTE